MEDIRQRPDGVWELTTGKGTYTCDHVVNAGGLWAREVGRMVGLELPVLAMEHHYLLTERIDAWWRITRRALAKRSCTSSTSRGRFILRQERDGDVC